jgi:hypothetical protein
MPDVTISNSVTSCPRCGGPAKVIDAKFSMQNGRLSVTLHPTPAQARRLRQTLMWAQSKRAELDDERVANRIEHQIRKEVPQAATWLDSLASKKAMGAAAWLSLLIALLSLLLSATDKGLSAEDVERIVQTVQTTEHEQQAPTPPTAPTPTEPRPGSSETSDSR